MRQNYARFLESKRQASDSHGFDPVFMPDFLFDFQSALLDWAVRKGRGAVFADCGLGKTPLALAWGENVVRHTGRKVLILTPLAVAPQFAREAEKFGIEAAVSRDGCAKGSITITNYEQLHKLDSSDFVGCVCDESSILKSFDGTTKTAVTEFMRTLPYRLLSTATAAPNDYIELGTSSEAIGELGFRDMLSRFFKEVERSYTRSDQYKGEKYRFRGHAERDFWRWVCSWSRSCRRPSDLGFDDGRFELPSLSVETHVIRAATPRDGCLFDLPAVGLQEQREERRRTIGERCERAASLVVDSGEPAVCWCHLNDEGDLLERLIPDAVQVAGRHSDEAKVERLEAFARGEARVLVTKPSIAGWGLNWQHCAHQTFFPSHSFEQWYQAVRRSWRFGQERAVKVDVVTSEGEADVIDNLMKKQDAANTMFDNLVTLMNDSLTVKAAPYGEKKETIPSWL